VRPEGDRYAEKTEAQGVGGGVVIGKDGSQHGAAAATEDKPEGPNQFG